MHSYDLKWTSLQLTFLRLHWISDKTRSPDLVLGKRATYICIWFSAWEVFSLTNYCEMLEDKALHILNFDSFS